MFTGESGGRRSWGVGLAAAAMFLLHNATCWAIYLDKDQTVSFRGRVYTQWSIRAEDSPSTRNYVTVANPSFKVGQLVQQRNFYNPELEANLTKYSNSLREIGWLSWLAPDNFSFRLAAWGFYDGVYDYGSGQYGAAASAPRVVPQGANKPFITQFGPGNLPLSAQTVSFNNVPCTNPNGCVVGTLFHRRSKPVYCESATECQIYNTMRNELEAGSSLEDIFDPLSAREVYGHQNRVNELYLNYSKGPLFVRVGRQSISWGESDTIALLDANNPFDITLGVPGFFQDLEEARIPLWTLRSSYELYRNIGPFSSGFIEGYWVPGAIDQHVANSPLPTGQSAYGPSGGDPHLLLAGNLFNRLGRVIGNDLADRTAIVLIDKIPQKNMSRSRGGARFQTIVGREHTVSTWWYRTYNNAPVARLVAVPALFDNQPVAISTLERADVDVFGIADTFFLEPIDSIIRAEAEYFLNELSYLEWRPAPGTTQLPFGTAQGIFAAPQAVREMANIPQDGTTNYGSPAPRTNHIRWELGLDRNLFVRWLNPSNSFFLATAFVGDYNLDSTVNKRYGFGPGRPTKAFEGFFQVTTQTDYMHGRLTPRLTVLGNYAGVFAFNAKLDYRITDNLIAGLQYALIDGRFHQIGFFRDYDQIGVRMTYQLN